MFAFLPDMNAVFIDAFTQIAHITQLLCFIYVEAHHLLQVLPGGFQALDDGFAHLCGGEDGSGGAEGEDLLQDLAAVEVVVVELHGVGVGILVVAGLFVVARKHHEAALDGVVLAFDAQGHALAAAREELLKGCFGALGDGRIKALD